MPYPAGLDFKSLTLADILEYASGMNPQEWVAFLRDIQRETGVQLPFLAAIVGQAMIQGPDANAAPVVANPVLVAGRDSVGLLRPFVVDPNGISTTFARVQGVQDAGSLVGLMSDRAGILAVGPPVTKLWSQVAQGVGGAISVAQAAPGAALYLVVLAWGYSIACGAAALAPAALTAVGAGARIAASIACPVNDMRQVGGDGPFIATAANTAITITGPAAPAAASHSLWMVGYTAAAP